MLSTLRIRNLALVADLTLELQPGFNAISGETGAGKSILIGALNLLLGARADRALLRAGAESCSVEAMLDLGRLPASIGTFLGENGIEPADDGQLWLKRTFTAAGTNRQFINGSPTPLQTLAQLGESLVDIHGPHDHQSLFRPAHQLELLDAHGGLELAREEFERLFDQQSRLLAEKGRLVVDEQTYARQLELLRHQVQEIAAARLRPEEEAPLEAEHARAQNAARLIELSQGALAFFEDHEDAVNARLAQLGRVVQDLARLDPAAGDLADRHALVAENLRELQAALTAYADGVDLDPARWRELEERLNLIQALRSKYGTRVADIIAFGERASEELVQLEGRDAELARLNSELVRLDAELDGRARELSAKRRQAVPKLVKSVRAELRDLGFRQSEFAVELRPAAGRQRSGSDAVEFQFAPNPGEPARPLRVIASSGELARVMLALKTALAAQDAIPIVVFDEVDANVGGETAHAIGAKMREIGRRRQVLCVTHLAPVAAAGDAHYVVSKATRGGRTVSDISRIEGSERVSELTRMLGGGNAAEAHARALIAQRANSH